MPTPPPILHRLRTRLERQGQSCHISIISAIQLDYLIQQFITSGIHTAFGNNFITVVAEEDLTYSLCP